VKLTTGHPQRRLPAAMTVVAAASVGAQAVTGLGELALSLTPLFLVVALLLSGRYLGEERIVRHWRSIAPPPRRRTRAGWAPVPTVALASIFERSSLRRRGPPAWAGLAA
jgi:hypothetical protein